MRVSVWAIRRAGSWGSVTGRWREATPHFIIILKNIRENETIISLQLYEIDMNYNPLLWKYNQRSNTKNQHGGTLLGGITRVDLPL